MPTRSSSIVGRKRCSSSSDRRCAMMALQPGVGQRIAEESARLTPNIDRFHSEFVAAMSYGLKLCHIRRLIMIMNGACFGGGTLCGLTAPQMPRLLSRLLYWTCGSRRQRFGRHWPMGCRYGRSAAAFRAKCRNRILPESRWRADMSAVDWSAMQTAPDRRELSRRDQLFSARAKSPGVAVIRALPSTVCFG